MVLVHVHATVAITTEVQVVDTITSKPSTYKRVGSIPFAPLAFIHVSLESALVVKDVLLM
jgi:hypothetical protein